MTDEATVKAHLEKVVQDAHADGLAFILVASSEMGLSHVGMTVPREQVIQRLRDLADELERTTPLG